MTTPCTAPQIPHAHLVSATSNRFVYQCNGLYSLVGASEKKCDTKTGTLDNENVACHLPFLDDVWFWLVIVAGILLIASLIVCLCIYCNRKWKRRRRRVRPPSYDEDIEQDVGCCEYTGSCDICCTDNYGCCSLLGCCGYRGCCACFCSCCRCCREPEVGPGISNLPVSYYHNRKRKKTRFSGKNKVIIVATDQINKKSGRRVKKRAKIPVVPVWLPHSNPVREFMNTSTK